MLTLLRSAAAIIAAGFLTLPAVADDKKPDPVREKAVAEGWIDLFDRATTFGWKIDGEATVKDGKLILGGSKPTRAVTTTTFPPGHLAVDLAASKRGPNTDGPKLLLGSRVIFALKSGEELGGVCPDPEVTAATGPYVVTVPAGQTVTVAEISYHPSPTAKLFNGKDLSGWKVFPGEKYKSKYEVTKDGELHVTNGPGDLQTEGKFADFLLQFECKTNGKALNSGIFFRCVDGQYQNGYEAQIQNAYKDNDRTKPADFGTGAIYRRVPARKVVSNDHEWFTMTVVANGPHIATWVNGYQTVDWTDERKPNDNPRTGLRTAAGHLSIQGHDPTTDILFRNVRIAEMKK